MNIVWRKQLLKYNLESYSLTLIWKIDVFGAVKIKDWYFTPLGNADSFKNLNMNLSLDKDSLVIDSIEEKG